MSRYDKTFRIPKPVWNDGKPIQRPRPGDVSTASMSGPGSYSVMWDRDENGKSYFYWSYCWDEYYDDARYSAESIKSAKQAAEAHQYRRISAWLRETA